MHMTPVTLRWKEKSPGNSRQYQGVSWPVKQDKKFNSLKGIKSINHTMSKKKIIFSAGASVRQNLGRGVF